MLTARRGNVTVIAKWCSQVPDETLEGNDRLGGPLLEYGEVFGVLPKADGYRIVDSFRGREHGTGR